MSKKIRAILKKIYRIRVLTIVRKIVYAYRASKCIKQASLKEIENYYGESKGCKNRDQRRVLVELLFFHPAANHASLIIAGLLSKKYDTKKFALVENWLSKPQVCFSKSFGFRKFVSVYGISAIWFYFKSVVVTMALSRRLKYEKSHGVDVCVDGVEIGRFIYDQYLRENNLPTMREITPKYLIAVCEGVFLYYRYKCILQKMRPTDIVLSHNVYAKYALIGIAAYVVDKSINIWQSYNLNPMNISCVKPAKKYVTPPRYYDKKWGRILIEFYGIKRLISQYDLEISRRYLAENKNDIDLEYVYKNNEIENFEQFKAYYTQLNRPIFIFAHAFVDAVKYTKWQAYSDYYTWLEETLLLLSSKSNLRSIYVKAHPSENLYPCKQSVLSLVERVNREKGASFIYLDKKVHNKIIFEIADLVITSNGTVGMEAVAAGVPVIAAASCEYEEADIVQQGLDINNYQLLISNVDTVSKPTLDTINSAKVCIMAYSKYMYAHATFLRSLNRLPLEGYNVLKDELRDLKDGYIDAPPLEAQEIYEQFSFMIKNNLENCIYLDPVPDVS